MTEGDKNILTQTLPLMAVIGLLGFFCWATYQVITEKGAMDNRVATIRQSVDDLTGSMDTLAKSWRDLAGVHWTRRDMAAWCWRTERENPGWRCPDIHGSTAELPEQAASGPQWVRENKRDAWKPVQK